MALIKCPKCNHEISDTSKKCIHCGTSLREKNIIQKKKKIILLVLVSLVIISIIAIASKTSGLKATKNTMSLINIAGMVIKLLLKILPNNILSNFTVRLFSM